MALHPGTPSAHQSYLTLTNLFHVLEAEKTRLHTILSTRPSHRPYIYPRWSSPRPSPPKAHTDASPPFEFTAKEEVPLAFPGEMRKKHNWLETGSLEDLRAINKERWQADVMKSGYNYSLPRVGGTERWWDWSGISGGEGHGGGVFGWE